MVTPHSSLVVASEALNRDAAGLVAGRLVMLGFVAVVMFGVVAFVFYLRRQARHPRHEVDDLESLTTTDVSDDDHSIEGG